MSSHLFHHFFLYTYDITTQREFDCKNYNCKIELFFLDKRCPNKSCPLKENFSFHKDVQLRFHERKKAAVPNNNMFTGFSGAWLGKNLFTTSSFGVLSKLSRLKMHWKYIKNNAWSKKWMNCHFGRTSRCCAVFHSAIGRSCLARFWAIWRCHKPVETFSGPLPPPEQLHVQF